MTPGMRRIAPVQRLDDAVSFEPAKTDEATFLGVLDEVVDALDASGIAYGFLGGLASAALGRPRWTRDIDLFVRPTDARQALVVLEAVGFATQETNPHWLFKAIKRGVLVDVLFRAKRDIYLDDEMIGRLVPASFHGRRLKSIPPEDLIVIKAIIHDEETPRHWFDALGLIAAQDLDWDYLIRRASGGMRRVLSLLIYAQSNDVVVPEEVVLRMTREAYPR